MERCNNKLKKGEKTNKKQNKKGRAGAGKQQQHQGRSMANIYPSHV